MIIPVRCITCGRVIAQHWESFKKRVDSGEEPKKIMDELGIENYCCRSVFVTHVDTHKQISEFKR